MDTPVFDYVRRYASGGAARFHMPGHKGRPLLGCEPWDITEIAGADSLYRADGILRRSEENAAALFGSAGTFYSAGGSSQCVCAMLHLALAARPAGTPPVVLAARNVHRSFVHAAALLGFDPVWLWPEGDGSLCRCPVTAEGLARALDALDAPPAAVYVTSPDYLGGMQDVAALAAVCRERGTLLLVDNAHGAYLHFLPAPVHPLDLGADLCCDSAHKTLPVLTGGAYLHVSASAPAALLEGLRPKAEQALALFGSTSPSYLILSSLDRANACLAGDFPARLAKTCAALEEVRRELSASGWRTELSDPLRLTVRAPAETDGLALAERLRGAGGECEYADRDFLVLMVTPENTAEELALIPAALGRCGTPPAPPGPPLPRGERVLTLREAVLSPWERVPAEESAGRVCALPTACCPPATPPVMPGERIGPEALAVFRRCGIGAVDVVKEPRKCFT